MHSSSQSHFSMQLLSLGKFRKISPLQRPSLDLTQGKCSFQETALLLCQQFPSQENRQFVFLIGIFTQKLIFRKSQSRCRQQPTSLNSCYTLQLIANRFDHHPLILGKAYFTLNFCLAYGCLNREIRVFLQCLDQLQILIEISNLLCGSHQLLSKAETLSNYIKLLHKWQV